MHDRHTLIRGLCKHFHRDLLPICVVASISTAGGKAGQLGELLCSPERLNILVKDLVGGKALRTPGCSFKLIRIVRQRSAVLLSQTWRHFRLLAAAMTRIASHLA